MIEIVPNWHPIFVHFTVALISASLIFLIFARLAAADGLRAELAAAGRWSVRLAALMTLVTVAAGFWAYFTVTHDDPAHLAMDEHRNWAIATALLIVGLGIWSALKAEKAAETSNPFLAGLAAAFILVSVTAYEGAELVYGHGIGVQSLPEASGEGHDHGDEAEGHSHGDEAAEAAAPVAPTEGALHEEGQAGPAEGPLGAVRGFHAALEAGDPAGVAAYLADDVLIYESGGAERSLAEYESHHLGADMNFAAVTETEVLATRLIPHGETAATVVSETRTTGQFAGQEIDSRGTETMTLEQREGSWVITHIHWSSR